MTKAIFFYEHINREFSMLEKLANAVQASLGYEVKTFSVIFEWKEALRYARRNKVDLLLVPWLYGDWEYALYYPFILMNPETRIINLHHEQISSPASENRLMPKTLCSQNGCYHFAWGELFANQLVSVGVDSKLIYNVGSMRIELMNKDDTHSSKEKLAKKFKLDLEKKWVLYAENRGGMINLTTKDRVASERLGLSLQDVVWREELAVKSLKETMHQFEMLPQRFFDDFELIYRPHPGTRADYVDDKRIKVISEFALNDWFPAVDLIIVWGSTSAFEAERFGVPVIRHEAVPNSSHFRAYGIEKFPCVTNIADITLSNLESFRKQQPKPPAYEVHYGKADGRALARYVGAIKDIVKEPCYAYPEFIARNQYRNVIRWKKAFEPIANLMVKTHLVQTLKWPRTAYKVLQDHPKNIHSAG